MGKLTNKRIAFVEHYLACWNASEAARRAGYKQRNEGHRLLTNADIQAHIKERLAEVTMSADEVLQRLAEIARNLDSGDYLKALHLIGKHHRLFVDVQEVIDTEISPADRMAKLRDAGFRMHPDDGNVDQES